MGIKELIFDLMMADEDEHGLLLIPKETREEIIDMIIDLHKKTYEVKKQKEPERVINLNEWIKVKLTDHGKDIHRFYGKQIAEKIKSVNVDIEPLVDENGYTEYQLWHFIELFGNHIGMGEETVIYPLEIVASKRN